MSSSVSPAKLWMLGEFRSFDSGYCPTQAPPGTDADKSTDKLVSVRARGLDACLDERGALLIHVPAVVEKHGVTYSSGTLAVAAAATVAKLIWPAILYSLPTLLLPNSE